MAVYYSGLNCIYSHLDLLHVTCLPELLLTDTSSLPGELSLWIGDVMQMAQECKTPQECAQRYLDEKTSQRGIAT